MVSYYAQVGERVRVYGNSKLKCTLYLEEILVSMCEINKNLPTMLKLHWELWGSLRVPCQGNFQCLHPYPYGVMLQAVKTR